MVSKFNIVKNLAFWPTKLIIPSLQNFLQLTTSPYSSKPISNFSPFPQFFLRQIDLKCAMRQKKLSQGRIDHTPWSYTVCLAHQWFWGLHSIPLAGLATSFEKTYSWTGKYTWLQKQHLALSDPWVLSTSFKGSFTSIYWTKSIQMSSAPFLDLKRKNRTLNNHTSASLPSYLQIAVTLGYIFQMQPMDRIQNTGWAWSFFLRC